MERGGGGIWFGGGVSLYTGWGFGRIFGLCEEDGECWRERRWWRFDDREEMLSSA